MASKTLRTLSTRVAAPFRKLSFSEGSRSRSRSSSRPPSRQETSDVPRTESPTPDAEPRSRVTSNAPPAPVLETATSKAVEDTDALDLDSPTGSVKAEPLSAEPETVAESSKLPSATSKPAPEPVDTHTTRAKEAPVHTAEGHPEPREQHHEQPPQQEEQRRGTQESAAPAYKSEASPNSVQQSDAPSYHPPQSSPTEQVPFPEEEGEDEDEDDAKDFHALMAGQNVVWADEDNGDVTISSAPVDRRPVPIDFSRPLHSKSVVFTSETSPVSPKDDRTDAESTAGKGDINGARAIEIEQDDPHDTQLNPTSLPESQVQRFGAIAGAAVDSQPTLKVVAPVSVGTEPTRAKPYTIPPVSALSNVSTAHVVADDDDNDGTFVARPPRAIPPHHKPYNLDISQWMTYALPTGATYYCHPDARIVTDVDIVLPSNLQKVCEHLDQAMHAHHRHHHQNGHVVVGRLIDDGSIPNTPGMPKSAAESRDYRFTAARDDQIGTEIWLRSLTSDDTFTPMTLWVDHLARTVAINPPWEQAMKGTGFDDVDVLENNTLRYWAFIESHPAHTGPPAGSSEEALEALSWCYTDWLLHPHTDPRKQPFSVEECRELLNLLKTLEAQSIGPLQTHIIAKIHVRLVKHHQAVANLLETEAAAQITPETKQPADPFGNFFVKAFIGLFCFGIPYKFVHTRNHRHPIETDPLLPRYKSGALLADSPIFAASLTLVAALLITSAAVLLALPKQRDASELSALISLFFSVASLASSIINLERRTNARPTDESSTHLHAKVHHRPLVRSLPLVFIAWSIIALVAAAYLYIYRVAAFPGPHDDRMLNGVLRLVVVAVGPVLGFTLLVSAWVNRRRS